MSKETFEVTLDAGTYYICSCGQSQNLPYCDGSHKGTNLQPIALQLESLQTVEISDLPESQSS